MFHVKHAEQLEAYATLVRRYHRTLDLMSERAVAALETKLAESLVYAELIAPHLSPTDQMLDVGSGVGLPGIPLALNFPKTPLLMVERRRKRASFLNIVVSQLGLEQVRVVNDDVRNLSAQDVGCFTWVTAQAVGSFELLYALSSHLHSAPVTLLSRRSDEVEELQPELEALAQQAQRPFVQLSAPLPTHGRVVGLRFETPAAERTDRS